MHKNQKGFSVVEILLVLVLLGLIVGGFFLVTRAKHNLSHSVDYKPGTVSPSDEKVVYRGLAIAYAGQTTCEDVPAAGLTPELSFPFTTGKYTVAQGDKLASDNKPTSVVMKTAKGDYPLVIDTAKSLVINHGIFWEFDLVPLDKDTALALTKTKATITYEIKGQSLNTAPFIIDTCVVKPLF